MFPLIAHHFGDFGNFSLIVHSQFLTPFPMFLHYPRVLESMEYYLMVLAYCNLLIFLLEVDKLKDNLINFPNLQVSQLLLSKLEKLKDFLKLYRTDAQFSDAKGCLIDLRV
jgi:hypothetical protein